ncbi:MAG: CDP-alcohol phosphatidyltransferase family protein [Acidobacteriota bacterium]
MTAANQVTLLRIVFVPVFILLVLYGNIGGALAIFLLAGATDLLDGLIARNFGQKTPLGILLDPVADKLLLTSSFILLSLDTLGLMVIMPLWLTVTVIARDVLLVLSAIVINLTVGRRLFSPSIFGKASTAAQLLAVFLVLLANYLQIQGDFLNPFFYLTLALTVISGLHYLVRATGFFTDNRKQASRG